MYGTTWDHEHHDEKILTVLTPKTPKNHQPHTTAATEKKDVTIKHLRTRSTFRQSLMASVAESQVVEKTRVLVDHGVKVIILRAVIVT